jgi:predicted transcriptional regulator of viral defense system
MAKNAINNASAYGAALAKREVALLARWERERRIAITLDELKEQVGDARAANVAYELVRKQVLQRIRRGSYIIRPLRTLLRPAIHSTPVLAAALLRDEPYYLGGLWAVSFHRLSEQRYASVVDAFVSHRLAPRRLGAGRVRFQMRRPSILRYGVATSEIEEMPVRVSDPERTVLDALDYPRLFGGLTRSVTLVEKHLDRLDTKKLLAYAATGSRASTCQRLGVLLERRGQSPRALRAVRAKTRGTRAILSLYPDEPRTGRLNPRWNVVENDP